ncbi:oxidative damage repair protein, partial [Candidatus Haloredivivus sp. G17]
DYLLLKRSQENSSSGEWTFPGGKIEHESRKSAALRELKEETDLEGEIIDSGEPYIGKGELGYWKIYPFHVRVESKSVELDHEHSEFKWLSLANLASHETMGRLKSLEKLDII